MQEYEEDDDGGGTEIQGSWVRKHGYVSEFDIDARWILYHANDERPQGSLRVVSHPDLPPGHLKSFVSFVTKRWPKTKDEVSKTLQNYGLLDNEIFYHNGTFFKNKLDETFYLYNNVFYKTKNYKKTPDGRTLISYADPIKDRAIFKNQETQKYQVTHYNGKPTDEHSLVTFSNPLTDAEVQKMVKSVVNELEAYNVYEHVETWDSQTMDKMREIEKMYNIKIFA
jgi:hypothetical protein